MIPELREVRYLKHHTSAFWELTIFLSCLTPELGHLPDEVLLGLGSKGPRYLLICERPALTEGPTSRHTDIGSKPGSPRFGYAMLGLVNLSEPQFPHQKTEDAKTYQSYRR